MSEYPDEWRIRAIDGRFAWLDDHADGWQFGETGFLKAICDRIGVDQAVEIGAGDGTDALPLTLGFLYERGFSTVLFEKNKASQAALKERYPLADVRGEWSLDNPQAGVIFPMACLVIDVDSVDYHIAESIACKGLSDSGQYFTPSVICIEHYDHCGPNARDAYGVPPRWLLGQQLAEGGFIIQAGSAEIEDMMRRYCYVLVGASRINSVYVRLGQVDALEGC
jgi:hypothetical protein